MADITFNTPAGSPTEREKMIAYLNTGTTANPTWSPVGKYVEESSIEFDWGKETKQDILGATYMKLKKPIKTQSFNPVELDAGDSAVLKLWNKAIKDEDYVALSAMDMLIVHFYAGEESTPFAERYDSCAIPPDSLGGAGGGTVGMPFEVTYGGNRTVGTAAKDSTTGAITFIPAT